MCFIGVSEEKRKENVLLSVCLSFKVDIAEEDVERMHGSFLFLSLHHPTAVI
jgi:hypothetical protein